MRLTLSGAGGIDHLLCFEKCRYELQFLPRPFRKLTANDTNQEIFSIAKRINAFFSFLQQKTSNIISKFNDDFSEELHISVGQKIKILETRPDFLTFSAKTQNCF